MKKLIWLLAFPLFLNAQKTSEITVNAQCSGTLYTPENPENNYLVILIAGSGPTDRDGNQPGSENNSLKFLAQELSKSGTAVFSYDKQSVTLSRSGNTNESDFVFDQLIEDARNAVIYFKTKHPFKKVIVAGHSEGSLIGMNAVNGNGDAFISLAGAGQPIDKVITEQIVRQAPMFKDQVESGFAQLRAGKTFKPENPMLNSIFRESVQPYLISWIRHDPASEIAKLKMPVLIINGDKDLQVGVSEAELLQKAKPDAAYAIIPNMNHILKEIKGDASENMSSYSNADLPVHAGLVARVNQFIKTL